MFQNHNSFQEADTRKSATAWLPVLFMVALYLNWLCIGAPAKAHASPIQAHSTLNVCPSGCDYTTLQDAINAAMDGDTIQLLATSPHSEFGILVDKSVSIVGLGMYTTTLQAAVLPYTAPGPVLTISPGKTVHIRDLTLRHGNATLGGGIYNDVGTVSLDRVTVRVNNATSGSGIYNTSTSTLTLNESKVVLNTAQSGGGIFNAGVLIMLSSEVTDHSGIDRGGGIYNTGNATLRHSTILGNAADRAGGSYLQGGGIYNSGSLTLIGSYIIDNMTGSGTLSPVGGGIYSEGELVIYDSALDSNVSFRGAGLYSTGSALIMRTQVTNNGALGTSNAGGGLLISSTGNPITIQDSLIENNVATTGGGIAVFGSGEITIRATTIHANSGSIGGGILVFGSGLSLTNVTISGNTVDEDGGGIYVHSIGEVDLFNGTITENIADADDNGTGNGGGLYLQTVNNDSGVARMRNTLIANNQDLSDLPATRSPDCHGEVISSGYNLIRSLGILLGSPPCSIAGETTGNQIGVDPQLDVLKDNGGSAWTHGLLPGSPAVNAGNPAGCLDEDDQILPADQRGAIRVDRCDIGAFELGGLLPRQYLPFITRP